MHVLETIWMPLAGIIQGFDMHRVTGFQSTVYGEASRVDGGKSCFPSQFFEARRNFELFEQLNAFGVRKRIVISMVSIYKRHENLSVRNTYFTLPFDAIMKIVRVATWSSIGQRILVILHLLSFRPFGKIWFHSTSNHAALILDFFLQIIVWYCPFISFTNATK